MALIRTLKQIIVAACLVAPSLMIGASAIGPYTGGPTHFYTTSSGADIAFVVIMPKNFEPSKTYPAIFEIAGYENGSSSSSGRTTIGQTKDFFCQYSPSPSYCYEPPVSTDSHIGTSAFRYDDAYVSVHASLPGTGCSSGEFSIFSFEAARAGYEVIENWIVKQSWSNGKVGILGHSYSGMTGFLVAAQEGLAAKEGRPHHLEAVSVSGMIDDVYRGINFPGGIINTLFPPLWYAGSRPAYDELGGSAQGVFRNVDNESGQRCAHNSAVQTRSVQDDALLQAAISNGVDNAYSRKISMLSYANLIDVPIHIAGAFQDEQTGGRFPHLWEQIPLGVPKRLVMANGDHGTQVGPREMWADRKAWMDYWMRDVKPDRRWGWTGSNGSANETSVRTLFELHPDRGEIVSNGHLDSGQFPVEGTRWTDYFLCSGRVLTTSRSSCTAGSDTYLSGSKRQSWNYETGAGFGPPVTTSDGADQLLLKGPVVAKGEPWAISGPILATLYLSAVGQDTDLFVQVIDEDTVGQSVAYLQRGWLKASHRAIDSAKSDFTDADSLRRGFMYRPWRPHANPANIQSGQKVEYLVEIWPLAHVFRPGHRLAVIVTAPPALDSQYSFAVPMTQPVSQNTLFYNDPQFPSRITLPVIPISSIKDLGSSGPGCPGYWRVRCVGNTAGRDDGAALPTNVGDGSSAPVIETKRQTSRNKAHLSVDEPVVSASGPEAMARDDVEVAANKEGATAVAGDDGPTSGVLALSIALLVGVAALWGARLTGIAK